MLTWEEHSWAYWSQNAWGYRLRRYPMGKSWRERVLRQSQLLHWSQWWQKAEAPEIDAINSILDICSLSTHPKFTIVLDSFLVIFLDVVREVIDGNVIMFNVFHDLKRLSKAAWLRAITAYPLFETLELTRRQRVRFTNNRNYIDAWRESAHQFDVHLSQTNTP